MQGTITFNLPEEKEEHEICVKAMDMHSVLWEFNQFMKKELKHNDALKKSERKLVERYQSKFLEMLHDSGIYFDK